jgi:hypothetical protein
LPLRDRGLAYIPGLLHQLVFNEYALSGAVSEPKEGGFKKIKMILLMPLRFKILFLRRPNSLGCFMCISFPLDPYPVPVRRGII